MTKDNLTGRLLRRFALVMTAAIITMLLTVGTAMYAIKVGESDVYDRITGFHLRTITLLEQIMADNTLLVDRATANDSTDVLGTPVVPAEELPSEQILLYSMLQRLEAVQTLNADYAGDEYSAAIGRLAGTFVELESLLQGQASIASLRDVSAAIDTASRQLALYHEAAIDMDLASLKTGVGHVRPMAVLFLGIACILLLVAVATWRMLREGIDREERTRAELLASYEQMHQMQKQEALGHLVGGIAHDFNNILTAILGHTSALRARSHDAQTELSLEEIQKAGTQASGLTSQLLSFSRTQSLEIRPFNINDVIRDMEDMLRRSIGEVIALDFQYAERLPSIEFDPVRIQQVVLNLVLNARDAMSDGGRIVVATDETDIDDLVDIRDGIPPGNYVRLTVIDTGKGMDDETQDKIFEPFFTTKNRGRGTGLGLSTVSGIVASANGVIRVNSEPGRGSRFSVLIPSSSAPAEQVHSVEEPSAATAPTGSETILLVEDESMILTLLTKSLEELGYTVLAAQNGHDALRYCEDQSLAIDLILSDVILPEMNGAEFIIEARKLRPDAAYAMMSGYTRDVIERSGIDEGSVPLIRKPFEIPDFMQFVRAVIEGRPVARERIINE